MDRRLFKSGRLCTLILALYEDLRARGAADPARLVEEGQLTIDSRDRVVLAAGAPGTWQIRTALLLVQLAHQARGRSRSTHHAPRRAYPAFCECMPPLGAPDASPCSQRHITAAAPSSASPLPPQHSFSELSEESTMDSGGPPSPYVSDIPPSSSPEVFRFISR